MEDRTVIQHDFGKEERESARRFARLVGLVEERNQDILANPIKYLDQAHDEIVRLRLFIEELIDLTYSETTMTVSNRLSRCAAPETMLVKKCDYEAFVAIRDRLRAHR